MKKYFVVILVSVFVLINKGYAVEDIGKFEFVDKVYSDNIKSMRMHLLDWEVSYPINDLYGDVPLLFSFDQIDSEISNYYYSVIHCTHDWKQSNGLMFFEYADGFEINEIYDYEDSHSTYVPFTHFKLELPNDDIDIKKSGNYLLVVASDSEMQNIVITKRFMLYEQSLDVSGRVNFLPNFEYNKSFQKLDFKINREGYEIFNPLSELHIVIMQNYQWNNVITGIEPSFLSNTELVYEWEDKYLFNAGNEYRQFSFNNLEVYSQAEISKIEFKNPYYYIDLVQDKPKMFEQYRSVEDINGGYVISTKRFANSDMPEIQADYAIVNFGLEYNVPINDADIYIYGELTNYELSEKYKLKYNLERRTYERLLFLKQGYYNYRYLKVYHDNTKQIDHDFFEGSHFETENNYILLIYHRSPSESYDKLVSYSVYNTSNLR